MARMVKKSSARSFKSVERLMLFLAKDVSLFQGNLVILLCFSELEFKVKSSQTHATESSTRAKAH